MEDIIFITIWAPQIGFTGFKEKVEWIWKMELIKKRVRGGSEYDKNIIQNWKLSNN